MSYLCYMRFLLFPLSFVYYIFLTLRSYFYEIGILKSTKFKMPILCLGNLSFGGTGKTPHTDFLTTFLKKDYKIAILSRGYRRKSKGFVIVGINDNVENTGDESLMLKKNHPDTLVVVCEDRRFAIKKILERFKEIDIIILDDGFQHKSIIAGFNILLTSYQNMFFKDNLFPIGKLRDRKCESKRAERIIITKCPEQKKIHKEKILKELIYHKKEHVYFSKIKYNNWVNIFNKIDYLEDISILLLTGVAKPQLIKEYLADNNSLFKHIIYNDHHNYTKNDIVKIIEDFHSFKATKKLILTTEKDAIKLLNFKSDFKDIPLYYLPIKITFKNEEKFKRDIIDYVEENKRNC